MGGVTGTSWIQNLKKDEIIKVCIANGLSASDSENLEQLRHKLRQFVKLKIENKEAHDIITAENSVGAQAIDDNTQVIDEKTQIIESENLENVKATESEVLSVNK